MSWLWTIQKNNVIFSHEAYICVFRGWYSPKSVAYQSDAIIKVDTEG